MADILSDSLRRNVPDSVQLYSTGPVLEELVLDKTNRGATNSGRDEEAQSSGAGNGEESPSRSTVARRAAALLAAKETRYREADAAFKERMQRKQVEDQARKEQGFQDMLSDVLSGLSNDSGIMGETQYTLDHSKRIRDSKRRDLHNEWGTEVFDKMQTRLQTQVDSRSATSIEKRLSSQMNAYLHTTNTKLGVFRDVIIESDYDPLAAQAASIRIPTGDIRDPLKRDMLKPMYERRLMGDTSPPPPLGKDTLDNKLWSELLIASTPYGHCMDKSGNYNVRPLPDSVLAAGRSRVTMDHYDFPTDNAASDLELGRPGKGSVPVPGVRANGLFTVVQQTARRGEPGWADGDSWVQYKGRAVPPGPEMRRGRQNLTETFQQKTNPYEDGRTLGDLWLEHKGRAMPPGPEKRRGRQNLTETFQQTTNPYNDGRTLGDIWLEAKGKGAAEGKPVTIGPVISSYQGEPDPPPPGMRVVPCHLMNDLTLTTKSNYGM